MADGEKRHGKEPAAAAEAPAEDKFPEGMRVLAVDDDPVCRRILEALLGICKYNAMVVSDGVTALEILRDGGEEQFDLVITDVHMPGMDGFKLLELIGLEMDLPVIMLSVNGDKETVLKGITHGACDYLVKPVHVKELKNIWQHVIRKNPSLVTHSSSDSDELDERVVQPVIIEGEEDGAKRKKYSKKKKRDGDDSDEDKESTRVQTTKKKPRVSWTGPLHNRFIEVVNHLGVDKAVPKTILQMMDVDYLTRECVASHLQKYRLYLKRVTENPRKANLHGNSFERRNSFYYMDMNRQGNSRNYYEHHTGRPCSTVSLPGSNNLCPAPSMLGTHDVSVRSMNWTMDTVGHGHGMPHAVSWLPDTGRRRASDPPITSFTNISSDHTKMDAFSPTIPSAGALYEKLLEAGIVDPSSNPPNSSLAEMPTGGMLGPVNQFPVQPPELVSEFFGMVNMEPSAVSTRHEAQFPHLVGSSSNPWQHVASSRFPDHMDGAPLAQSQVNFPQIDQLHGFGASPRQMPMFYNEQRNEMAGIINNNNATSVVAFSEQMMPLFDMASNRARVEMSNDNFSPMGQMIDGGSTSSPLRYLQTGSSVAPPTQMVSGGSIVSALPDNSVTPPAQMVNGGSIGPALPDSYAAPMPMLNPGDPSGILHVQEGPADDEQALDDQPNYTSSYFLEDIFTGMLDQD